MNPDFKPVWSEEEVKISSDWKVEKPKKGRPDLNGSRGKIDYKITPPDGI